jgi:hypothetical protein
MGEKNKLKDYYKEYFVKKNIMKMKKTKIKTRTTETRKECYE